MNMIRDISLYLLTNILGFLAAPIVYNIAIINEWIDPAQIQADPAFFQEKFFTGTIVIWITCALIGLGFFLINGKMRLLFLLLPALIPLFYGFNVLNGFSVAS